MTSLKLLQPCFMAKNARISSIIVLCAGMDSKLFCFALKKILAVPLDVSLAYKNTKMGRSSIIHSHLSLKDVTYYRHNNYRYNK